MRYAVLSDLHGNRQALQAVLTDIRGIGVDRLICLGDCVGYGPCPGEVLESAYAEVNHFVLGNHDAVIAGRLTADCFQDEARAIIDWTRTRLDAKSGDFFRRLPLVLQDENFSCAHAEFSTPGAFNYIFDSAAALSSFSSCSEQTLFVGHSHVPGLYVLGESGVPHWLDPVDFALEPGKRYLINTGSVGQPRDDDVRASYAVFDIEQGNIFFRKVPFDIEGYRRDLEQAGLPVGGSRFLDLDRSLQKQPLRELVSFRPARDDEFVAGENDVQDLEASLGQLKKSNRRLLALSAFLALLVLFAAATAVRSRSRLVPEPEPGVVISAEQETLSAGGMQAGAQLLAMPVFPGGSRRVVDNVKGGEKENLKIGSDSRLENWSISLGLSEKQEISLVRSGEEIHFQIVSGSTEFPVKLYSPPAPIESGQRVQVRATFFNQSVDRGFAEIYSEYTAADGTVRRLNASTIHDLTELDRWSPRAATSDEFQGGGSVRYVLEARFAGELLIRDCAMFLR